MSYTVPPSLAFFIKHPIDVDSLGEYESRPETVSEADWRMFKDVMARAGQHAAQLVTKCRDAGLESLAGKVEIISRTRDKTAAVYWYSRADMWIKSTRKEKLKIWIGAGVAADSKGDVWIGPFVSVAGDDARVRKLALWLMEKGVSNVDKERDTSWFDLENAPLELIQLRLDSDLDKVIEQSRAAFARLSEKLGELSASEI
jgi:hypothetical protein